MRSFILLQWQNPYISGGSLLVRFTVLHICQRIDGIMSWYFLGPGTGMGRPSSARPTSAFSREGRDTPMITSPTGSDRYVSGLWIVLKLW